MRVLGAKQPLAFLLENVPGLLQCDGGRASKHITTSNPRHNFTKILSDLLLVFQWRPSSRH